MVDWRVIAAERSRAASPTGRIPHECEFEDPQLLADNGPARLATVVS